ncbi:MAG: HAMP domain-containing protein [Actinobacteria bacterium]|nr:MAG: HAMP domain-containing protein [Actinomycetota bacterium]
MNQAAADSRALDAATSATEGKPRLLRGRSGLLARIALSAVVVSVGLAIVFGVLFLAIITLRDRSVEAAHTQQVIASANRLQTLVIDLETSVRGFVISGNERDLGPWLRAQKQYPTEMEMLLSLTKDNPQQHLRALALRSAIHSYLSTYSRPLVRFIRGNPGLARDVALSNRGRTDVEKIRARFSRFLDTETALSNARQSRARTTAQHALWVGGAGLGASLLLILLGALYLNRAVARPVRLTARAAARIAGGDFSERLRATGPGEVGELERTFNTMVASLERTLADLEERNRTLAESEQVKGELVSNVSHELRTPLASVLGFSALMLDRDLPPHERRRYLEVIRTEAHRLAALLNDLLDLQRVEQEALELRHEAVNLNDLLAAQVTLYSAQSEAHALRFEAAGEPLMIRGDRDRLAQVIGNLLSNGIKYSPEGGEVEVGAGRVGDEVTVWVRDRGLGIPKDHQDRIFTKFFRGDVGRERGIAGTGLGLVLARQIVEAHGGEVGFESEEGAGSTFWFRLPAAAELEAAIPEGSLAAHDDS